MTEELKQNINEAIKKSLPSEVGELLKKELALIPILQQQVVDLKSSLETRDVTTKSHLAELEKYKQFDERNKKLEEREKLLEIQERDFKVKVLEDRLATETDKSSFCREVALGLVRNINYRKSIIDSENQAGYMSDNNRWVQLAPVSKSLTETKTTD